MSQAHDPASPGDFLCKLKMAPLPPGRRDGSGRPQPPGQLQVLSQWSCPGQPRGRNLRTLSSSLPGSREAARRPRLWGDAASRMLAWSSRAPRVHAPQERWARPLLCAGLLAFLSRWPGTKRWRNRGTFMRPLPACARAPRPVFFSSRAAGIQWAETLPPGPLRRHKRPFSTGAPDAPRWRGELEGERPGLLQRPDCVLGPRSEQGLGSGGRSQPEPAGQLWGEGQGQTEDYRRGVKGPGGLGGRGGACPLSLGTVFCSPPGIGAFWMKRVQPGPLGVRNPTCGGLGGGAASPAHL